MTDRHLRRNVMFLLCLVELALVGAGTLALQEWLEERPGRFLLYWGFAFLNVALLILLALYDILRTWRGERR